MPVRQASEVGQQPIAILDDLHTFLLVTAPEIPAIVAFESNPDTRRMFTERGICCCPISKPDDLPCLSKFTDS